MSGHTSGPWALMASYPGVSTPRGDVAFAVDDEILTALQPGSDGLARRWANARLIAAAPELLAALVAAESTLREYETKIDWEWGSCTANFNVDDGKWGEEIYAARAAIAKATGSAA